MRAAGGFDVGRDGALRREDWLKTILKAVGLTIALVTASHASSQELKFNTQDFPPFNYEINGVVSGPAADIIRRVCVEIDVKCSFSLLPWTRAQDEVRKGKANGMFIIGWNETRAKWVHFTPPIMNTEYGLFVSADNELEYKDLSDIQGYEVGVYGPSNTSNSLDKLRQQMEEKGLTPIRIDMRPDDESGFRKLSLKRLDAVFSNRDVGYALIAKLGSGENIRYAGPTKKLKYYIGFSKEHNDEEMVGRFNEGYLKLFKDGEITRILESYNMEPAEPE